MEPIQTGICILVLDPDQSSTERTVSVLGSCQYKVIVAERATEALLILSESRCKIHIVLTEFDLPDMNGIEFIEKVRKMRNMPVFFLSTFVDHGVKIQCVLKGARYCYDKPLLEYQAKNLWQSCVPKRNPSTNSEIPDNRKIPKKREMRCTPEELHRKFVLAVNCLGFYAAQPKRVLELMDVPGLTIEYVADQLQRYHRLFMDQKEDKSYGPLNMNSEPRNMNPSSSMGIGGNIYNEQGREVKLDSEKNHQNGIQTFNWEPNVSNHLQRYPLHMDMHSEPRNMNLSPSMGVGSTINNELGREAKLESEENRQIGLQTMNLEPNVAGTSGGGNLNRNIPENSRNFLARGRMPPANIMNAYKK